ncbi:MAG: PAS domain S-box protein [Thermodesulfobacteriota bacterium]
MRHLITATICAATAIAAWPAGTFADSGQPSPAAMFDLAEPWGAAATLLAALQAGFIVFLLARSRRAREAEDELRRSGGELEKFFSLGLNLLAVASMEGRFLRLNAAWESTLGYTLAGLEGLRYMDLVHPEDREATARAAGTLRDGSPVNGFVNRYRRKDGSYRRIEWAAFPHDGNIYAMARDVTESSRALELLRESEERFRTLLDTVETVSVQGYSPEGVISYWNAASETVYGYSREEALGKNLVDLIIPGPMRDEVRAAIRGMAETGRPLPAGELVLARKDGTPATVFSSHAVVKTAGGETILFCMDVDISGLKKAQDALRESEERLRMLVESAGDALYLTDLTGRFVDVNPEAERMTGFTRQELLRMGVTDLDLNQNPESMAAFARVISSQRRVAFETLHKTKAGGSVPVELKVACLESAGKPLLMGIARDITVRKRAEETLTEANRVLTAVLDSVPAEISAVDVETHEILFMNTAMKRTFRRDCTGETCYRAFRELEAPCENCGIPALFGEDGQPCGVVAWEDYNPVSGKWNINHDKAVRWLDGRMARVQVAIDISGRKLEEDRMAASLKEKEVLLREIHHRVKNNLQIVSSLLSLQEGLTDNPEAREVLADSMGRVTSMAMIHEHLYRSDDLTEIDMESYLRQLLPGIVNSLRGHKDITLEIEAVPLPLSLEQAIPFGLVMNELAVNALKHGFAGRDEGTLRVSVHPGEVMVAVEVADDGNGLPEGFDPARPETLGMQLVTTLTGQLGGMLEAESGKGAKFSVTFPLARA